MLQQNHPGDEERRDVVIREDSPAAPASSSFAPRRTSALPSRVEPVNIGYITTPSHPIQHDRKYIP